MGLSTDIERRKNVKEKHFWKIANVAKKAGDKTVAHHALTALGTSRYNYGAALLLPTNRIFERYWVAEEATRIKTVHGLKGRLSKNKLFKAAAYDHPRMRAYNMWKQLEE